MLEIMPAGDLSGIWQLMDV